MIPPSIPMIVFAVTGGLSVGAAFLSTVVPGAILAGVYVGLNFLFLRKVDTIAVEEPLPFRAAVRKVGRTGADAFWALLMPVIFLGTIYSEIATPTEAAAIALVYVAGVGFLFYRKLNLRNFPSTVAARPDTSSRAGWSRFAAVCIAASGAMIDITPSRNGNVTANRWRSDGSSRTVRK